MSLQVSGRSRGRAQGAHPPHFWTNLWPEGPRKIFFLDRPIPLISGSGWPGPPLSEDLDPPMQVHYNNQVTFLVVSRQLMVLYSSYQTPEYNTINWRDTTQLWLWRWLPHRLSKRQSLSTTTVLFRTMFTRRIKLNLLLKWLLGSNLSQSNTLSYAHFSSYHPTG